MFSVCKDLICNILWRSFMKWENRLDYLKIAARLYVWMPSVLCKPLFITRTCSNLEICAEQNQQLCFCCTEVSVCTVCTRVCSKCFITAPGPAVLTDRCDLTFDTCPSAQCSHPPCRAPGTTPLFCFHGSQLSGSFGIQVFFLSNTPIQSESCDVWGLSGRAGLNPCFGSTDSLFHLSFQKLLPGVLFALGFLW